jgi:hypothetical protein
MKALVYHGTKDLRYQDFPDPQVNPGEVRLRIKCSGLCHTDFNEYVNGPLYVAATPHKRTGRLVPQTFPLKDAWDNLTRFEEAGRANIKMLIEMDA